MGLAVSARYGGLALGLGGRGSSSLSLREMIADCFLCERGERLMGGGGGELGDGVYSSLSSFDLDLDLRGGGVAERDSLLRPISLSPYP